MMFDAFSRNYVLGWDRACDLNRLNVMSIEKL